MDHKVSKDMISSGMIPSGEKTQADLGRTQYGSAPSPNSLFDTYKSIYEHHQKDKDGNTIPHEGEELNEGKIPAGLQAYLDKKKGKKEDKKDVKEMIERVKGVPPAKPKVPGPASKPDPQVDKMKGQIADRKKEVASEKDARREKIKGIMNKMGESADLFDIVSTYFIEEGYDKKDVYEAMSSVDLSEEVQDLHEVIPLIGAALAGAGKLAAGIGAKVAAGKALAGKALAAAGKIGTTAGKVGSGAAKVTKSGGAIVQGGAPKLGMMGKAKKLVKDNPMTSYMVGKDMMSGGGSGQQPMTKKTGTVSASADLFDIVKGQLLDEGLSEEEIKDIMLTLTPDEIIKELEESSLSAGSSDGHYHDGGDGVFRSKEQIGNMFNKNIPTKKQTGGKVDKMTRKSINTSARELGIQGPTTLKQSVEPEGETI